MKIKIYKIKNTKDQKSYVIYLYKKTKTTYITVGTFMNPKEGK